MKFSHILSPVAGGGGGGVLSWYEYGGGGNIAHRVGTQGTHTQLTGDPRIGLLHLSQTCSV